MKQNASKRKKIQVQKSGNKILKIKVHNKHKIIANEIRITRKGKRKLDLERREQAKLNGKRK